MGTTIDGIRRTNSRYRAYDGPGRAHGGDGNYGGRYPGWSGSHDRPIEGQRKQAVELCYVPETPISRYHIDIAYGDHVAGAIWFSNGRWRMTIGQLEYGPFKTYLGARKFAYTWFSGLDIDPGDIESAEPN